MEKPDIHNYKRRLERTIERISNSNEISERDKEVLIRFKNQFLLILK